MAFGTALQPLRMLEHLCLGIHLSTSTMFDRHLSHVDDVHLDHVFASVSSLSSAYVHEDDEPIVVHSPRSCSACVENYAEDVRKDEVQAAVILGTFVGGLKYVTWHTFFALRGEGDDAYSAGENEVLVILKRGPAGDVLDAKTVY